MAGSQSGSIAVPCLTYKDANAGVGWLCRASGLHERAAILPEPCGKEYGGRDESCRHLEGNIWSFGAYNPWTADCNT
ncbi:MAG: hypothetical protein KTR19_09635 [Hyphomicrobiales bacterium]|nr:hypothetical protein [Hyphomicrobiales bacterium]